MRLEYLLLRVRLVLSSISTRQFFSFRLPSAQCFLLLKPVWGYIDNGRLNGSRPYLTTITVFKLFLIHFEVALGIKDQKSRGLKDYGKKSSLTRLE